MKRRANQVGRWKKAAAWLLILQLFTQPVLAATEVVVDPSQGKNPSVMQAANGTKVVQIVAPNAAGVSHNQYRNLQIGPDGIIYNNGVGVINTKLAGYIVGNSNLVGGSARVILNEVTGNLPTQLNGFQEIAGQKAALVLANPNGIVGSGFGFINADRAVLTTGTPIFGGSGSLEAFRVNGGQIAINGSGLNASEIDRVDLLARSVQLNAQLTGKDVHVVTGANVVNFANDQVAPIAADPSGKPAVALDVAALGGMYANKITLVGTESGVGVNSQGLIQSSGDIQLTQSGRIQLSGNLIAGGNMQINAQEELHNQGTAYAAGKMTIQSQGLVQNTGTLAAGDMSIQAQQTLQNDNATIQAAKMDIAAQTISNRNGQIAQTGTETQRITATTLLDNSGGRILSNGKLALEAGAITNPSNSIKAQSDASLTVNGDFTNQGTIASGGVLTLAARNLSNAAGASISAQTATLSATGTLTNAGQIEGDQVNLQGAAIDNSASILGSRVTLNAADINNHGEQAVVGATDTLNLWAQNTLTNRDGATLISLGDVNMAADGATDGSGKLIHPTGTITNQGSTIEAGKNLNITANQLNNLSSPVTIGTNTVQLADKVLTRTPHFSYWVHYFSESYCDGSSYQYEDERIIQYGDFDNRSTYTSYYQVNITVPKESVISFDNSQNKLSFYDVPVSIPILPGGTWGMGGTSAYSNGRGPLNWPGKVAGQTTAYCDSLKVDANGNYVIAFYPGYDPNLYLHPSKDYKTMRTYHCDSPINSRTIHTSVATDYVSNQPIAGKLHAGGDINFNISGKLLNQYSDIAAGGAASGTIGDLQNQGYQLKKVTTTLWEEYYRGLFQTGGDGHTESSDGRQTVGPYVDTQVVGSLPATFTASSISLTGGNVENVSLRPDGTAGPQIGTTPAVTPPTGTVVTAQASQQQPGGSIDVTQLNGLYSVKPDPTAKYLVETNPRFANYQKFISSDYMLNLLPLDPGIVSKRIGDGFYEQKLVSDQIHQLTGRQYLSGYSSANDEYKALLDNGVAMAKAFQLTPGVALSASQIANLTSDMVWLVEKEVKLPDGTTQKALVPTVYLAQGNRLKLSDSGALIAADKVDIRLTGTLTNSGSIAGGSALGSADTAGLGVSGASTYVAANNIINQAGGSISSNGLTNLNAATDLVNQGGSISGQKVLAYAGRDLKNEAATSEVSASYNDPGHSWSGSSTVVEKGSIAATGDIQMGSGRDLSLKGAQVTSSSGNVAVSAGGTLDVGTTQAQSQGSDRSSNSAAYDHNDTVQVTSSIQGKAITLASQNDMKLQGAQVAASDTLNVAAGGDLQIAAAKNVKTSAVRNNHNGSDYKEDNYDETVVGSQLQAKNNVSLQANGQNGKGNLSIVGSSVGSENGELNLSATKAITLGTETERHESHRELHNSGGDFFSSSSSDEVDHTLSILAKGSVLSGDRVTATAGGDLTVRGSQVVATKDTKLQAVQGDVNLTAAQQTFAEEHERHTDSSGIFSSGAGLTIGSQSTKLNTDSKTLANVGSTIGSLQGNVTIGAGNNVNGQAVTVISGKDTVIQGKDIKLVGAVDTQDDHLRYEESKSGLTLSLGGAAGDALTSAYSNINAASGVQDGRLKALYDYRAAKTLYDYKKTAELPTPKDGTKKPDVGLSISIGSSRMLSDTTTHSESVNSGSVQAGGDVRITASRDLTIGTPITGTNVTLAAQTGNLNVEAGQEKGSVNSHNESSSWAVGGTINSGYFGSFSQGSGKENGTTVTNVPTIVTARDKASLASGNDTNIVGSNVAGKSVTVQTGGNLNLVSLQDTDNYNASNEGFSLNASAGTNGVKSLTGAGSYNTGTTNSNYASVTKQAGIYAGKDGFDIQVGKNTDLKGAVIASDATPDKNKLSTGTLTYSDIQNKAEYNVSSSGVNYNSNLKPGMKLGELGTTPSISVESTANAASTTKSAISPGTIIVGGKSIDLATISRDTSNSLNTLGKIFDKQKVEERQELIGLFGEIAAEEIHKLSDSNGWKDGDTPKVALHTFLGAFMAQMSGGNALSGGLSGGLNEALQNELKNLPVGVRQWASYVVGSTVAKITGGNPQTGGSIAVNGTKNNSLFVGIAGEYDIPTMGTIEVLANGAIVVWGIVYTAESVGGEWIYDKAYGWLLLNTSMGDSIAQDVIAKEKKGSINREFPAEWLDKSLKEIETAARQGDASARTAKKLLKDKRFDKGDNRK